MINRQQIHAIVSMAWLAISIFMLWLIPMSEFGYSVLMCLNFIWVLYVIWKAEKLSPFFLFMATFTFLFIGGRFWAELVMPDEFILRRGNFFNEHYIQDALWHKSLTYILLFLHLSTSGYLLYPRKQKGQPYFSLKRTDKMSIDIVLLVMFCVLAPFTLHDVFNKLTTAASGDGYLSIYQEQTENVSAGSGLIASMLYVFVGIALVYGKKSTKILYLILLSIKALVFILIGQRAKFGSMLLFLLWYFLRNKKVNIVKIGIFAGIALLVLVGIASLSIRQIGANDSVSSLYNLCGFFYQQGVSLTTFTSSQEIECYPILPYFVSFIPGIASLTSLVMPLPGEEASFANYLAYTLSPELFASGHGLGWTLLSDLYLYSGRTFTVFAILSALFGLGCSLIEDRSRTSALASVIVTSVLMNFTFLPRAGLYTIIPLIVWILAVYFILMFLLRDFREATLQQRIKTKKA